jgi:hypothetical protein
LEIRRKKPFSLALKPVKAAACNVCALSEKMNNIFDGHLLLQSQIEKWADF